MNYIERPNLIEPGTKFFFKSTLKECSAIKQKYMNRLYNITMLVFFLFIFGCVLFYNYKGRLNKQEQYIKQEKERQYILEKVRSLDEIRKKESQERITNLPILT
tara:strand:+ start:19243 stop:19554 length:312 start_codon:yes stop_codon:yes gene_type:complete